MRGRLGQHDLGAGGSAPPRIAGRHVAMQDHRLALDRPGHVQRAAHGEETTGMIDRMHALGIGEGAGRLVDDEAAILPTVPELARDIDQLGEPEAPPPCHLSAGLAAGLCQRARCDPRGRRSSRCGRRPDDRASRTRGRRERARPRPPASSRTGRCAGSRRSAGRAAAADRDAAHRPCPRRARPAARSAGRAARRRGRRARRFAPPP